jgi:hypothetical protein
VKYLSWFSVVYDLESSPQMCKKYRKILYEMSRRVPISLAPQVNFMEKYALPICTIKLL